MYYGFDIGGTKIALGVFDKDLKLQWETRVPTPRESYDEFLTAIAALVAQADERFGVKGSVGIGIPGMPETDDGTLYAANVPAASGKPLRALSATCAQTTMPTVLLSQRPGTTSFVTIRW